MEGRERPYLYTCTPSIATRAEMMRVDPDFTYCTIVEVSVYTSGTGPASMLFMVDSLNYTIREGEVFDPT